MHNICCESLKSSKCYNKHSRKPWTVHRMRGSHASDIYIWYQWRTPIDETAFRRVPVVYVWKVTTSRTIWKLEGFYIMVCYFMIIHTHNSNLSSKFVTFLPYSFIPHEITQPHRLAGQNVPVLARFWETTQKIVWLCMNMSIVHHI